jgi:lysozyme family protein
MRADATHQLTIQHMINDILEREQAFVDHAEKDGGPSRYGINREVLGEFLGRNVSRDDIVNLSPGMAATIYRQRCWHKPHIDRLPLAMQPLLFDAAVSHGPRVAISQLQRAINRAAVVGSIEEDGRLGPHTLQAAQLSFERLGDALLTLLLQQRARLYEHIVESDPDQRTHLAGWLGRLRDVASSQGIVFEGGGIPA